MKFESDKAPKPVGAYPHARKVGNLLFLSGVGPRKPNTKEIPGVELDKDGNVIDAEKLVGTLDYLNNKIDNLEKKVNNLKLTPANNIKTVEIDVPGYIYYKKPRFWWDGERKATMPKTKITISAKKVNGKYYVKLVHNGKIDFDWNYYIHNTSASWYTNSVKRVYAVCCKPTIYYYDHAYYNADWSWNGDKLTITIKTYIHYEGEKYVPPTDTGWVPITEHKDTFTKTIDLSN